MILSETKLVLAFDAKRIFNNFTGLGNYSRNLVKNLQKYYPQHEYHLFTPKVTENDETRYFLDSRKFFLHTSSLPLYRTLGIASALKNIKADIYHGLSHEIPLRMPQGVLSVVTFHDLIYEVYPKLFGLCDRHIYKFKYRFAAQHADVIVSVSENTKKDLIAYYSIPSQKIEVIYQTCHDVFQNNISSKPSLPDSENSYYLYVGSVIPRKNLITIIKAYAQLEKPFQKPFVVVGTGPVHYMNLVQSEIVKYNLSDNFTFLSQVDNQHLVEIYEQAFALVYPSIYEGFGIPIIESLFLKKPVITSNLSSLPEAIGPGGICINPYYIEELTAAFRKINHPETYDYFARQGYDYVQKHFSGENTARQLMNLYLDRLKNVQ